MSRARPKAGNHPFLFRFYLVLFILAGLGALCALGWYCLGIMFTEDLYPKKGTFEYYLGVDSDIRRFPLIGLVGEAEYYRTCGDGTKLPGSRVSYHTNADKQELIRGIDTYLVNNGFAKQSENPGRSEFVYTREGNEIEVRFEDSEGTQPTRVVVRLYY